MRTADPGDPVEHLCHAGPFDLGEEDDDALHDTDPGEPARFEVHEASFDPAPDIPCDGRDPFDLSDHEPFAGRLDRDERFLDDPYVDDER